MICVVCVVKNSEILIKTILIGDLPEFRSLTTLAYINSTNFIENKEVIFLMKV